MCFRDGMVAFLVPISRKMTFNSSRYSFYGMVECRQTMLPMLLVEEWKRRRRKKRKPQRMASHICKYVCVSVQLFLHVCRTHAHVHITLTQLETIFPITKSKRRFDGTLMPQKVYWKKKLKSHIYSFIHCMKISVPIRSLSSFCFSLSLAHSLFSSTTFTL